VFINGGLQAVFNERIFVLGNTCNIDCTLMILQSLWSTSEIGRRFITTSTDLYPDTRPVIRVLESIANRSVGEGKLLWWREVLNKSLPHNDNYINMLGK